MSRLGPSTVSAPVVNGSRRLSCLWARAARRSWPPRRSSSASAAACPHRLAIIATSPQRVCCAHCPYRVGTSGRWALPPRPGMRDLGDQLWRLVSELGPRMIGEDVMQPRRSRARSILSFGAGIAGSGLGVPWPKRRRRRRRLCQLPGTVSSLRAFAGANGGLAQQGLPLTDEFPETNPTNGSHRF